MLELVLETLSGHWTFHLESRVPRTELYEARIASSKPSPGFFILLISSAVIASLGLFCNSTAVVIGAMIIALLMDPILSLAFGLAVSDGKLIHRSAVTIAFGVLALIGTAALISLGLGISHVQSAFCLLLLKHSSICPAHMPGISQDAASSALAPSITT